MYLSSQIAPPPKLVNLTCLFQQPTNHLHIIIIFFLSYVDVLRFDKHVYINSTQIQSLQTFSTTCIYILGNIFYQVTKTNVLDVFIFSHFCCRKRGYTGGSGHQSNRSTITSTTNSKRGERVPEKELFKMSK